MVKTYKWYNPDTGEEVLSDSNNIQYSYDEGNDESILFLGDTNVAISNISGEVDTGSAKEIGKELGWKVKVNTLPLKEKVT